MNTGFSDLFGIPFKTSKPIGRCKGEGMVNIIDPKIKDFNEYVDEVIRSKIKPRSAEWKRKKTTPPDFFQALGEEGLLGYRKEESGIRQIPWSEYIYFYRKMSEISGGLAIAAFVHSQCGVKALHSYGVPYQQQRYFYPGIEGKKIFAIANTEPGAGSDAASISMTAKETNDHFILNGTKAYITNGDNADTLVVTAITDPDARKKHRGISMFIVDGNSEGLTRRRMAKYGWAESHLSTLEFNNVKVPKENLLGDKNRGFYQTMEVFDSSRIGIAAIANGSALGAFRMSLKHNKKREIFSKPIFDHESKRAEYADRITMLQAGWLMVQKAAEVHERGGVFYYYASMAKLFNTEEGIKISHWAALNFPPRTVLDAHPVSQFMLDSNVALIGEGAPEVQRKIISENIDNILEDL
jgi:alkylation response protein AidB-like acyl-CoA dehydrogenase